MGPRADLVIRRRREAPPDLAGEALRRPHTSGKKARPRPRPLLPIPSLRSLSLLIERCIYLLWRVAQDVEHSISS